MGRKKKEKVGIFDRIGEEINLEKCPECLEHTDCYSCLEGRCTALNVSGGQGCAFYKPADQGLREIKESFQKLKDGDRSDVIQKYEKTFVALDIADEDIEREERMSRKLDSFRREDFKKLMTGIPGFS